MRVEMARQGWRWRARWDSSGGDAQHCHHQKAFVVDAGQPGSVAFVGGMPLQNQVYSDWCVLAPFARPLAEHVPRKTTDEGRRAASLGSHGSRPPPGLRGDGRGAAGGEQGSHGSRPHRSPSLCVSQPRTRSLPTQPAAVCVPKPCDVKHSSHATQQRRAAGSRLTASPQPLRRLRREGAQRERERERERESGAASASRRLGPASAHPERSS
jgi:hypothetical protein